MAIKVKPSINKRNREFALRERQKEKAARREQRAAERSAASSEPSADPTYDEFQKALRERQALDAEEAARDEARRK